MEVRHVRGQTVYKQKDLRLMCQQFWLANRCPETGVINVKDHMTWDNAEFTQSVWREKEEAVREERVTFSWGEGIGFYHGEANLKKAIRKKECWWVKIKGFDGQIHKRLQRVNFIGTPVYQMSCSLEIKDHKRIKLLNIYITNNLGF